MSNYEELHRLVELYICTPNTDPKIRDYYDNIVEWYRNHKRPDGSKPYPADTEASSSYIGIHEEFVRVIQGASSLYSFGSDRVNNAEDYCRKHAEAMTTFNHPELHPDTCAMWRHKAREHFERICKAISAPPVP